jgi:hypothetical protein
MTMIMTKEKENSGQTRGFYQSGSAAFVRLGIAAGAGGDLDAVALRNGAVGV